MATRMNPIFEGHGSVPVKPTFVYPGTRPINVTRSTARLLIANFEVSGRSFHSRAGGTLWVVVEHCQHAGLPYVIEAIPYEAYSVALA